MKQALDTNSRLNGLVISLVLYAISLALPAFYFSYNKGLTPLLGHSVLAGGWWGFLTFDFAWYANPLLWIAWSHLWRNNNRKANSFSIGALVVSLQSFFAREWWFNEGSGTPIQGLGPGFYVWIVAITVIVVATLDRSEAPWNIDSE